MTAAVPAHSNLYVRVQTTEEKCVGVFVGLNCLPSFLKSVESVLQHGLCPDFECGFSSGGKNVFRLLRMV